MDETIEQFNLWSRASFGSLEITADQAVFYNELNDQILHLCKSLPASVQTGALLLFLKDHRGTFSENIEFFRHYAKPSWSVVYWLTELGYRRQDLLKKDRRFAVEAHAMAMFLHAIDDHLHDGELALNHLTLLIRSQAWLKMQNALKGLANGLSDGESIISGFLDQYYSSIEAKVENQSFDQYCELFRSQMATAYTVPALLIRKISSDDDFYSAILSAYGSFGIAWRLLDDLNDIKQDIVNQNHSAVYCCLTNRLKALWDRNGAAQLEIDPDFQSIADYIMANHILDDLVGRIYHELESAAAVVDKLNLNELAAEFRLMARPFKSPICQ